MMPTRESTGVQNNVRGLLRPNNPYECTQNGTHVSLKVKDPKRIDIIGLTRVAEALGLPMDLSRKSLVGIEFDGLRMFPLMDLSGADVRSTRWRGTVGTLIINWETKTHGFDLWGARMDVLYRLSNGEKVAAALSGNCVQLKFL